MDEQSRKQTNGFTLVEMVVVILMIAILGVIAAPKFNEVARSAKIASLQGVASAMDSAIMLIRSRAYIDGLKPATENPGGTAQTNYIVTTQAGDSEVDWRNLCPESEAELGDKLNMAAHVGLDEGDGLILASNNQYTWAGFEISTEFPPSGAGCYVIYDSFGDPECTVELETSNC